MNNSASQLSVDVSSDCSNQITIIVYTVLWVQRLKGNPFQLSKITYGSKSGLLNGILRSKYLLLQHVLSCRIGICLHINYCTYYQRKQYACLGGWVDGLMRMGGWVYAGREGGREGGREFSWVGVEQDGSVTIINAFLVAWFTHSFAEVFISALCQTVSIRFGINHKKDCHWFPWNTSGRHGCLERATTGLRSTIFCFIVDFIHVSLGPLSKSLLAWFVSTWFMYSLLSI